MPVRDFATMQADVQPHILRMFEGTVSFDATHFAIETSTGLYHRSIPCDTDRYSFSSADQNQVPVQTVWMSRLIRIYTVCHSVRISGCHPYLQQWPCPISMMEKSVS